MWWNVPAQTFAAAVPISVSSRPTISRAARRVKVTSRIDSGGTPLAIK